MMGQIRTHDFKTPYGELILASFGDKLCLCDWKYRKLRTQIDQRIQQGLKATFTQGETPVIQHAVEQLGEYFEGRRTEFSIPLLFVGTAFQQTVWNALLEIKYGQTNTYLILTCHDC